MIIKKRLPMHEAQLYLTEEFEGARSLSLKIKDKVLLYEGNFFTYCPDNISNERLLDFSTGGLLEKGIPAATEYKQVGNVAGWSMPVKTLHQELVLEIESYVSEENINVVFFENSLAKPTDAWLNSRKSNIFFLDDTVIHYVDKSNLALLSKVLSESGNANTSFAYFSKTKRPLKDGDVVVPNLISEIHENLEAVVLRGVYDGEGFIIKEIQKETSV